MNSGGVGRASSLLWQSRKMWAVKMGEREAAMRREASKAETWSAWKGMARERGGMDRGARQMTKGRGREVARRVAGAWARAARAGATLGRVECVMVERRRRATLWRLLGKMREEGARRRQWRVAVQRGLGRRERRRERAAWEAWMGGLTWRRRGRQVLARLKGKSVFGLMMCAVAGWRRAWIAAARGRMLLARRGERHVSRACKGWREAAGHDRGVRESGMRMLSRAFGREGGGGREGLSRWREAARGLGERRVAAERKGAR